MDLFCLGRVSSAGRSTTARTPQPPPPPPSAEPVRPPPSPPPARRARVSRTCASAGSVLTAAVCSAAKPLAGWTAEVCQT